MKLGMVTYNLGREWDVETIIANCEEAGFEGVELRTTQAHEVETDLTSSQRADVAKRFADSKVTIAGLGSACEYDALDPDEVRANIDGTKQAVELARDLSVPGVKVRPNRVHEEEGIPIPQTLEQIGLALRECGQYAANHGVEIRLEVHGRVTCHPPHIRTILDHADHPNVKACWNSNMDDIIDGTIDENFDLLKEDIALVHITELWSPYPWKRLFQLLKEENYKGFCLAEIPESPDPIRLMHYYRALWLSLADL